MNETYNFMSNNAYLDAASLRGKTLTEFRQVGSDRIEFATSDGKRYVMFHSQDCCESVSIHGITGDPQKLIGKPLLVASEESQSERPEDEPKGKDEYEDESNTWTTYSFETEDAKVRLRWHGSSNGYYSESVQIDEVG